MIFHWKALSFVFCLFKAVSSYHFRYAYVGSFLLVYLASFFLLDNRLVIDNRNKLLIISIVYSLLIVISNNLFHKINNEYVYFDCFFIIFCSLLIWLDNRNISKSINLFSFLLVLLVIFEMSYNFILIAVNRYSVNYTDYYNSYYNEYKKQIDYIFENDKDEFRISQTSYKDTSQNNISASYNDSMALNFKGIVQYTSGAEKQTMYLLLILYLV